MGSIVKTYFEEYIIPLIIEQYPELESEMSILIGGSVGLGVDDEGSDLDAFIYLDDPLWKSCGGQLQLMLIHQPQRFSDHTFCHPEICVHPTSWLLNGHHQAFLSGQTDLPWEKIQIWDLFELQHNLVLRDPQGIFCRLREATTPEQFPAKLWQKLLMLKLNELLDIDDHREFERVVGQGKLSEAYIILGWALEGWLHLGFLIEKQYYPYRKHLRWAFEKLPVAARVSTDLDVVVNSPDWQQKVSALEAIKETFKAYIGENIILSSVILDDLTWATRSEAWANPNWREPMVKCRQRAIEAGYEANDGWIWSLWNWA